MLRTKKIYSFNKNNEQLKQIVVSEFDDQQNEIERFVYNAKNELVLIIKKEFNQRKKLVNSKTFSGQGRFQSMVHYIYDPLDRLLEEQFFNAHRELISRNLWTFEQDRLIKFEKIKKEKQLAERKEFKYNKNHKLSELWIFNHEGQLTTIRCFFYNNKQLTEEHIFSPISVLKARKILRYNELNLQEFVFWYDAQGKNQRTEYFEYHQNGQLKAEVVNDIFGQQFFRKKFNVRGQILTAYHLYLNYFETIEIYYYDDNGNKLKQKKYSIKGNQKFPEQKIMYFYDKPDNAFDPKKVLLMKNIS